MENITQDSKISESLNQKQVMSRNIMFVKDEKSFQDVVYTLLKPMGFEVTIVSSGFEALSLFVDSRFAIVIIDYAIPHMNSLILATNIKKISPSISIILLVDGENEDDIDKLKTGRELFYSIIFKPFKMNELQNAIEGALIY